MLVLLLLLGCHREPESIADCEDPGCRAGLILARWEEDPDSVPDMLDQISEPLEKLALVERLVELKPGQANAVCERLPRGPERERCTRINYRPHLWVEPATPAPAGGRRAGGPPGRDVLPAGARSRYEGVRAAGIPKCEGKPSPHACISQSASAASRKGDARSVAAICAALEGDPKWREECLFNASEGVSRALGAQGYEASVDLCLLTGPFAANCLSHLSMALVEGVPASDQSDPAAWASLLETAEVLRATWTERDPSFVDQALSRFWSDATARSFGSCATLTGDLFDLLPPEAIPHIHAAAALRLLQTEGGAARELDAWAARLDAALALRKQAVAGTPAPGWRETIPDHWPSDLEGEDEIPATIYLGTSRRAWSSDPALDRKICLLEAAALMTPVETALLTGAASDSDPILRWTAHRLLEGRTDGSGHRPGLPIEAPAAGAPGQAAAAGDK